MSKKTAISIFTIQILALMPLAAQEDELPVTFNLGGGFSVPLNPTRRITGTSGSIITGAGATFGRHSSLEGDFLWSGLASATSLVNPVYRPSGSVNLYSTGNYRFRIDSIAHSPLGVYAIAGGGWYYRLSSVQKNFVVPPQTVCQPIYNWWGYSCQGGYVYNQTVISHGSSAGGVNAGVGLTIRMGDEGWKFYMESRYTYVWSPFIPTKFIPVTFGFRYN